MIPPRRAGFSLLEVLVATAILMGSAAVLFQLAGVGTRHATGAQKLADAQWSCQAKLGEILAGVIPIEQVKDRPLANKPGWVYSVEVEPVDEPDMPAEMALLRVTVAEDVGLDDDRHAVRFTLRQWIRDPHLPEGGGFPDSAFTEGDSATVDDLVGGFPGGGGLR